MYVQRKELEKSILAPLNHVRLFKQMILPCELLGLKGEEEIKSYKEVLEKSCLKWKILFPEVPKLSKKSISLWNDFILLNHMCTNCK